ncbi:MAG: response regulator [Deltaproteobacteria bacterium]
MNKKAKLKILIAEDDKDLLALYDKALPDLVFDKRLVINGEKALEAYKTWHPDILVLDIIMPVMTGYSALKEIREVLKNGNTTIVISTSIDDMDEVSKCERLGIQGYIVKPFDYKKIAYEILKFFKKNDPERADVSRTRLEALKKKAKV